MAKFQSNDFDFEIWQCRHIKITETADKIIEIKELFFVLKTINIFVFWNELFCSDCKIFSSIIFFSKQSIFGFVLWKTSSKIVLFNERFCDFQLCLLNNSKMCLEYWKMCLNRDFLYKIVIMWKKGLYVVNFKSWS